MHLPWACSEAHNHCMSWSSMKKQRHCTYSQMDTRRIAYLQVGDSEHHCLPRRPSCCLQSWCRCPCCVEAYWCYRSLRHRRL
ncbi:hypothetical protein ACFPRL_36235 [Pseudoclavibacter helvolus]